MVRVLQGEGETGRGGDLNAIAMLINNIHMNQSKVENSVQLLSYYKNFVRDAQCTLLP
jgi:hypothetical protein